jgi:hypothetical protein
LPIIWAVLIGNGNWPNKRWRQVFKQIMPSATVQGQYLSSANISKVKGVQNLAIVYAFNPFSVSVNE